MSAVEEERTTTPAAPGSVAALVAPVLLGAVLGGVGGWFWWRWWGPAPDGQVYDTPVGPTWYPDPFDPGVTRDFSGTATYVVLGFGLALLLGAIGAWWTRHRAVVGLAAVLLGSVVAGALMTVVGIAQSPSDPQAKVDEVEIGTELPGHLHVAGVTPYLAWPVGALLGYLVVMLSLASRSEQPAPRSAGPGPQD